MNKKAYIFPLSHFQERLWVLYQLNKNQSAYNVPIAVKLTGDLNIDLLCKSIQTIIDRHEILRTSFKTVDDIPKQLVEPDIKPSFHDLLVRLKPTVNGNLQEQLSNESQKYIDLSVAPAFQLKLFRLDERSNLLFINFHHIIFDEWSARVFFRELKELYEAFLAGREPALEELLIQYGDYALWQRDWLQEEELARLVAYWTKKLKGMEEFELPADRPRPIEQTFKGQTYTVQLNRDLSRKVKELAQAERVTLNTLLLAMFDVLLYRYTQQENIAIGMPIANRNQVELENLIGFFLNTLVIRVDLSGQPTFQELLKRVQETLLESYKHQDLPFENLVQAINPERALSRTPLFQVMFVMVSGRIGIKRIGEMEVQPMRVKTETSKFDLTMFVEEVDDQLQISLEYSTDLFDADRIERMAGHYQRLLEDVVINPGRKIWELEMLTEAERHQILVKWNDTAVDYPRDKCVHQLFEEQVVQTPDATAVVYGKQKLTYRELNQRANQLGHYLQKMGVGPEVLVGICVERSLEMIVGLLGILKAGGAYVPLDPSYPIERLQFMIKDARVPVLLTHAKVETELALEKNRVVYLDKDWDKISGEGMDNIDSGIKPENLIYVIYTSGSTGKPKGAGVSHVGFTNLTYWYSKEFNLGKIDRTLLISSFSFDLTQKNIFVPLCVGGQLHLLASRHYDPNLIVNQINSHMISWINCSPSAFYPLLNTGMNVWNDSLRFVFLGGEPINVTKLENWITESSAIVVNTYGPTECTDVSSFHSIDTSIDWLNRRVPIGKPIYNAKLILLDTHSKLVPIGIPGELCIGGDGVGRGYLNNDQLNRSKFVALSMFDTNEIFYRTGDIVRLLPDGAFEFLGRVDGQVKIRGYRVELGEVENALIQYPAINDVVVLSVADSNEMTQLVAYVVTSGDVSISELQLFLHDKLPAHMIPTAISLIDELPLTPSGKVDRKALLALKSTPITRLERSFTAPRNATDEILIAIWSEVLGVKNVGINDNFFALGGNSLSALIMISKARYKGIYLDVKKVMLCGTIEKIIDTLNPVFEEQNRPVGKFPILPTQIRFLRKMQTNQSYNLVISSVYEIAKNINFDVLTRSIEQLTLYHDNLRTRFVLGSDGMWYQELMDHEENSLVSKWDIHDAGDYEAYINAVAAQLIAKINIFNGPLFHVALFNLDQGKFQYLLLVISHLIADLISEDILLQDIEEIYLQLLEDSSIRMPPRPTSTAVYAERLVSFAASPEFKEALGYWLNIDVTKFIRLPSEDNTDLNEDFTAKETVVHQFMNSLKNNQYSEEFRLADIVIAAFAQSYHIVTGSSAILFRMSHHGRVPVFDDVDLSRTVGYLSDPVLTYLDVRTGEDLLSNIIFIHHQLKQLPNQGALASSAWYFSQDVSLSRKIESLYKMSEISINIMPPTTYSSKSLFRPVGLLKSKEINIQRDLRKVVLRVWVDGENLISEFVYDKGFVSNATINNLVENYSRLLEQNIKLVSNSN